MFLSWLQIKYDLKVSFHLYFSHWRFHTSLLLGLMLKVIQQLISGIISDPVNKCRHLNLYVSSESSALMPAGQREGPESDRPTTKTEQSEDVWGNGTVNDLIRHSIDFGEELKKSERGEERPWVMIFSDWSRAAVILFCLFRRPLQTDGTTNSTLQTQKPGFRVVLVRVWGYSILLEIVLFFLCVPVCL